MIVLVVSVQRVFPVEGEGNSPVAADRHRPSAFPVALQLVQPQTRKRHVLRRHSRLQLSQDEAQPLGLLWPDASLRTRQEEALQPLMLEAPDHLTSVTSCVTQIKTPNDCLHRQEKASAAPLSTVRCNAWFGLTNDASQIGWAERRTPSARATFNTVSNLGFAPGDKAL
jgi:hypothetical protein